MISLILYLAQTLPDLHEAERDELGRIAPEFKVWMADVILYSIVVTIILGYLIDRFNSVKRKPITFLWIGVAMYLVMIFLMTIYSTFSDKIYIPVFVYCAVALWVICKSGHLPKIENGHREQKSIEKDKIIFNCHNCGRRVSTSHEFTGQKVSCPKCEKIIIVP